MNSEPDGTGGPPDALTVHLDHLRPGVPLVRASGWLNHLSASSLQQVLHDQLAASPWALVVDLSSVDALDAAGVSTLVGVAHRAGHADIGLYLVAADTATAALAASDTEELFEIYQSVEAALHALTHPDAD